MYRLVTKRTKNELAHRQIVSGIGIHTPV